MSDQEGQSPSDETSEERTELQILLPKDWAHDIEEGLRSDLEEYPEAEAEIKRRVPTSDDADFFIGIPIIILVAHWVASHAVEMGAGLALDQLFEKVRTAKKGNVEKKVVVLLPNGVRVELNSSDPDLEKHIETVKNAFR